MKRVVIIGGGIAGLAAAYRLQTLAREQSLALKLTLIERDTRLGGKIITERIDDFVVEGGPDSFLAYKPWGVALCKELGIFEQLHGTNQEQRKTYVMRKGKLHRLPEGLTGMIPTAFKPMATTSLISPLGKVRMALDFALPPHRENSDESLGAFISRRLGREVYDWLIEPLMGGIYAGDASQLSLAATFPQLRQLELEHGGLIRGMLKRRKNMPKQPAKGSRSAFLSPRTGLTALVEALTGQLGDATLMTGIGVDSIEPAETGYTLNLSNGDIWQTDAVILATPAYATANMVQEFDPKLAETLAAIPYVSTATISVAYPLAAVPRPLDGYGYVIPRAEGRDLLACTWTSTKFPHRAPQDYALIRVFAGRAGQQAALQSSDDHLLQLVRAELARTLGITAAPDFHRIFRWPKAMPQYTLGHLERLAQIDRRLAQHSGLYVAGAAYRGIGIPDCINSGEQAARATLAHLTHKSEQLYA